jgi:hypothetical protein
MNTIDRIGEPQASAVREHASGSHGHALTREHILSELQPA